MRIEKWYWGHLRIHHHRDHQTPGQEEAWKSLKFGECWLLSFSVLTLFHLQLIATPGPRWLTEQDREICPSLFFWLLLQCPATQNRPKTTKTWRPSLTTWHRSSIRSEDPEGPEHSQGSTKPCQGYLLCHPQDLFLKWVTKKDKRPYLCSCPLAGR